MGRKKKPFINKKEAQKYRLVPRSHQDPRAGDANESQYVLKAENSQAAGVLGGARGDEDRIKEQQKFGIYFEDNYDYLQHLKAPGAAVLEPRTVGTGREITSGRQANLPDDLFGHEVTVIMDKVLPVTGPRPDWDPEIVEALENAEVSSEAEQQLEDDFVMLASAEEQVGETSPDDGATPWWQGRGDFKCPAPSQCVAEVPSACDHKEEEEGSVSSGAGSTLGSMDYDNQELEKKPSRFTEYSISSSKVPRSEALTLLDDQFEEFMAGYGDQELGAREEEGEGEGEGEGEMGEDPNRSEYEQMLLHMAMEDFERNFQGMSTAEHEVGLKGTESGSEDGSEGTSDGSEGGEEEEEEEEGEEEGEEEEEEEERDLIEVDETSKHERWDCESFLSTYSTQYNHPTKIVEPTKVKVRTGGNGEKEIRLSKKTGIPLGVIPGPLPKENHPSRGTITRPRNESKEEKRARKHALKEDRKQRRADKKATKQAFKSEAIRQSRVLQQSSAQLTPVA